MLICNMLDNQQFLRHLWAEHYLDSTIENWATLWPAVFICPAPLNAYRTADLAAHHTRFAAVAHAPDGHGGSLPLVRSPVSHRHRAGQVSQIAPARAPFQADWQTREHTALA